MVDEKKQVGAPYRIRLSLPVIVAVCCGSSLASFGLGKQAGFLWTSSNVSVNRVSLAENSFFHHVLLVHESKDSETSAPRAVYIDASGTVAQLPTEEERRDGDDQSVKRGLADFHHLSIRIDHDEAWLSPNNVAHQFLELAALVDNDASSFAYGCEPVERNGSHVVCVGVNSSGRLSFVASQSRTFVDVHLTQPQEYIASEVWPRLRQHLSTQRGVVSLDWFLQHRGQLSVAADDHVDLTKFTSTTSHRGKELIVSARTAWQRVDVYEYLRHGEKNRVVWLDQVTQSTLMGDAAYHEALVHPAVLAHPNPKSVAIIGGGEGATLREVLRHRTVDRAVMVEIDQGMVDLSRKFLPEWSDCSDIDGSLGESCFEDPRAEVYYEDAIAWFIDRFGEDSDIHDDGFDVIIMDAL